MRRDITDVWLRGQHPAPGERVTVWDTRQRLLLLTITSRTATWSIRQRLPDGRRSQPTLGRWPEMGVAAARKAAEALLVDIRRGADPVTDRRAKRAAREARAALPTVAQRLAEWQSAKLRDWSATYTGDVARFCANEIVPHLGDKPLVETGRSDWTALVARKRRQSPSSAANLYRIASSFLNFAEAAGWVPLPLLPRKGQAALAPSVEARTRVLTDPELAAIWHAADAMAPKPRAFVHLLMMTGARRQEVADISTGEVDRERGTWRIPEHRAKNHIAYTVPLHPLLLADLAAIWPEHDAGPSWKLLGAIKGSGLSVFSRSRRRRTRFPGSPIGTCTTSGDRSGPAWPRMGIDDATAEAAINHISGRSALIRTYDRHDRSAEVLQALSRWQLHVESLVTETPRAKIFQLPIRA